MNTKKANSYFSMILLSLYILQLQLLCHTSITTDRGGDLQSPFHHNTSWFDTVQGTSWYHMFNVPLLNCYLDIHFSNDRKLKNLFIWQYIWFIRSIITSLLSCIKYFCLFYAWLCFQIMILKLLGTLYMHNRHCVSIRKKKIYYKCTVI